MEFTLYTYIFIRFRVIIIIPMIQLIDKLEVSINQRFDHINMLTIDSQDMHTLIKDDQKKRNMVRNFRIIKAAQKNRVTEEAKWIGLISKLNRKLSKHEIIVCENMITNCVNQYLNTEYIVKKNGDPNDLIDVFIFYYQRIRANNKVKQMTVIKNCGLLYQLNFMGDNLQFFLSNVQTSINCLYECQKNKFFKLIKQQNKSISPEKKGANDQEQDQRFDSTGNFKGKKKRQLQLYCFELSKLLTLEHIYLDYYYFSSMDFQRRKKMLQMNYLKRNVFIKKLMQSYEKQYTAYKQRQLKQLDLKKKPSGESKLEEKADKLEIMVQ